MLSESVFIQELEELQLPALTCHLTGLLFRPRVTTASWWMLRTHMSVKFCLKKQSDKLRSKRRLPVLLSSGHTSFNLFKCHKHHNVPRPKSQERRHEPKGKQGKKSKEVDQTGCFIVVWFTVMQVLRKCVFTLYRRLWVLRVSAWWQYSW